MNPDFPSQAVMAGSTTVINTVVLWKTWNFLTRSVTVVS